MFVRSLLSLRASALEWRGNPPAPWNQVTISTKNSKFSRSVGQLLIHFSSNRGIATTSVRTGLAMTGNSKTKRKTPIKVIGFNKLVVKFKFVGFVPPIVGRGYDPAAHVPMREMYVLP